MHLFAERDLREYLEARLAQAREAVERTSDDELLATDEHQLVDRLVGQHVLERLVLGCEDVHAVPSHRMVPAEEFPPGRGFTVWPGKRYRKPVMSYRIPYTGNR